MTYKLIGKDFTPHDVVAKVTGQAKYAEDFRADGMVFCRLLLSPMPHARVRNIDASEALKMEGVFGILTPDDVTPRPRSVPADPCQGAQRTSASRFVADGRRDETTAQDAIEKIKVDLEPLPFTVDPLQSLFPGGPERALGWQCRNGVPATRRFLRCRCRRFKWTAADFAKAS